LRIEVVEVEGHRLRQIRLDPRPEPTDEAASAAADPSAADGAARRAS